MAFCDSPSMVAIGECCDIIITLCILTVPPRYLSLLGLRKMRSPETMMKGRNPLFDEKLNWKPLVMLERMEDGLKETYMKRKVIQSNKENPILGDRKDNFLFRLGLLRNSMLEKTISTSAYTGLHLKQKGNRRHKFCCAGLASSPQVRWYTGNTCHWDFGDKYILKKQFKLSPRICVKKWLGGERIVTSKRKFQILAKSLIPKTKNHSSCKDKPRKSVCENGCNSDFIKWKHSILEKEREQKTSKALTVSEQGVQHLASEIHMHTNSKWLSRNHLDLPYGYDSPQLVICKFAENKRDHIPSSLCKGRMVNPDLKELQICLKRWEGKDKIKDSQELKNVEVLLAIPAGSSHRACRKAKMMEESRLTVK